MKGKYHLNGLEPKGIGEPNNVIKSPRVEHFPRGVEKYGNGQEEEFSAWQLSIAQKG